MRHFNPWPVLAANQAPPAGRALRSSGRVRRPRRSRSGAGLPARRVRTSRAQLLSRLESRGLVRARDIEFDVDVSSFVALVFLFCDVAPLTYLHLGRLLHDQAVRLY